MIRIATLAVMLTLAVFASAEDIVMEHRYTAPEFSALFVGCNPGHFDAKTCYDIYEIERKAVVLAPTASFSNLTEVVFSMRFGDNDSTLAISYIDYPPGTTFNLDAGVRGVFTSFTTTTPHSSYHTLPRDVKDQYPRFNTVISGIPARGAAWEGKQMIDGDHPVKEYVRVFAKGSRLWTAILYCSNGQTCSNKDADKFFSNIVVK
jgi:hypothetical protein